MNEDSLHWNGKEYPKNQFIIHQDKIYARVSSVLRKFVDFGDIRKEVLDNKAALGTRVHNYIQQEIEGDFPIIVGGDKGYFQSFDKWRMALQPTFIETEVRYYNDEFMITGMIDALVEFQGKKECILVDWKTSVQESPIVWPMQAHLYHLLLTESGKSIAPNFLFVKLDKEGMLPKVFQYKFQESTKVKCLHAVEGFWSQWR